MSKYRITGEQTIYDSRNLLHYDLRRDAAGCRRLRTPLNNGTPVSNLGQVSIAEEDHQCRASRFLHWTEDSRLHAVVDDRHYSYCAYDHGGERRMAADNGSGEEVYYYHSDHLDSASWITDGTGTAIQHLQYLPYGEDFVNQRQAGYNERYTFTGKEKDSETGYGYFGARYMDHELMTMWLSVDPMADKYPNI
ncbi:MAG: hypothetical protein IJU81_02165 [Bacteroidales bacterium]|nr:hypothetical protein [Bacteroidales bacterium]